MLGLNGTHLAIFEFDIKALEGGGLGYRAVLPLFNGIIACIMAKFYGSIGILIRTRVVVKAEAHLPYCFT